MNAEELDVQRLTLPSIERESLVIELKEIYSTLPTFIKSIINHNLSTEKVQLPKVPVVIEVDGNLVRKFIELRKDNIFRLLKGCGYIRFRKGSNHIDLHKKEDYIKVLGEVDKWI